MSGKTVIVMGKKGVVANKTGSDGDTTNDEIYNVRFEDGGISTHPVRDMQMIGESVERLVEMNPTEHVKKDDKTGMYCVYNKDGKKVKEFKDKADADKWATDNHDSLMESIELDEGTPAYRKAMAAYKNSDTKKVFDILKKKGFRAYAQSDTLVRNMLKKNKGNVQKAAAEIEKKYPGHFVEHLDVMQPHGMFGGFGAQKKKSTLPSRPTRIAVSKEFDKVTRSGKMDTMAAKKHLEKKFKITDVRIEKDKNGKPHVTYFQESVELDEVINSPARGRAKEANVKRGRTSDPGGDMVITAGKNSSGKVFYATSIDRTSGDILKVGTNAKEAVKLTKGNAAKLVRGKASFVTAINLNKGIGNTKKVSDAELKKLIGESVELDEANDKKPDHTYHVKNIDHDTDARTAAGLPTSMKVKVPHHAQGDEDQVRQHINKTISNETGYTHHGYDHKRITTKKVTTKKESVELDEAPKADMRKTGSEMLRMMPKDLKSKIEKGQLKVVDSAPSWLGGKSEFQILQYQPVSGPSIGGQRDPYLMVIVSNPEHKPMKIFAYYGTHPSRKALMFAKNNKLLESVEVDEATKLEKKDRQLGFRAATAYVKQKGKDPSGPEARKYNRISNALDAVRKKRASKITDSVDVHKVEHDLDEASRPMQFPGAMSGGKMKGKFTSAQLKQLKDAYAKIGRVDPSSKAYEKLTAFLDAQDKNVLQQLANARIQFISSLALNRVNRLKGS